MAVSLALSAMPAAAGFPAQFELTSLDGTNGFVLKGVDPGDRSGNAVSTAGDINGDRIDDFLIAAYFAHPNGVSYAGETYVVFGGAGLGASGNLALSGLDGTDGFVMNGFDAYALSARSISGAGDVNGDGFDDVVIGANFASPDGRVSAGKSHVVFGGAGVGGGGSLELSSLDGANGFVLNGIDDDDWSGRAVSGAGDVNADGVDDLIIAAPFAGDGQSYAGETYVIFGHTELGETGALELAALDGSNGFVLSGSDAAFSGRAVSGAGDVNGDSVADLIIGDYRESPDGALQAGQSYVVFGRARLGAAGTMDLSALDGTNGFALRGIDAYDRSGHSVSAAGDINGDGVADLIIGAPASRRDRSAPGESYLVFGDPGLGAGGSLELSALDGSNGFVLEGFDSDDRFGYSVAGAGDVDGDGIGDLIIGAFGADPGGRSDAGESYVVFGGAALGAHGSFQLAALDGTNGFVMNGIDAGDSAGYSASGAGDVNGDGLADLIVGARFADPDGKNAAGESYIVFGRPRAGAGVLCDGRDATIVGTERRDFIAGTSGSDVIHGLGGNDTIQGNGGNDIICGGNGHDVIHGNAGHDRMFGDAGHDRLMGGAGRDFVRGGPGNDVLNGGRALDWLFGDEGKDQLFGGEAIDHLRGGSAFDRCNGGPSTHDTAMGCEQSTNIP